MNLNKITNNEFGVLVNDPSWFSPGLGVSPIELKHTTWGFIKQREK
jgi:hypothetical protein